MHFLRPEHEPAPEPTAPPWGCAAIDAPLDDEDSAELDAFHAGARGAQRARRTWASAVPGASYWDQSPETRARVERERLESRETRSLPLQRNLPRPRIPPRPVAPDAPYKRRLVQVDAPAPAWSNTEPPAPAPTPAPERSHLPPVASARSACCRAVAAQIAATSAGGHGSSGSALQRAWGSRSRWGPSAVSLLGAVDLRLLLRRPTCGLSKRSSATRLWGESRRVPSSWTPSRRAPRSSLMTIRLAS